MTTETEPTRAGKAPAGWTRIETYFWGTISLVADGPDYFIAPKTPEKSRAQGSSIETYFWGVVLGVGVGMILSAIATWAL